MRTTFIVTVILAALMGTLLALTLFGERPARAKSRSACVKAGCKFDARRWKCVCPKHLRTRGGPMVRVKGGCFRRGSDSKRVPADRRPLHTVCVSTFYIDKYEVTVNRYRKCVRAGKCTHPTPHNPYHNYHKWCSWNAKGKGKHALNCVDWYQAKAFCKWAGKRLPTEAEWQYAAVGKDGRKFPWGNQTAGFCGYAIVRSPQTGQRGCGRPGTWPVGSRPAGKSPFGAMDMVGNVVEWVEDCYNPRAYAACGVRCKDPVNRCSTRALRSYRGSSWSSTFRHFNIERRGKARPSSRVWGIGFRCAK